MQEMQGVAPEFAALDHQLAQWSARLISEVRLSEPVAGALGSTIAREVAALDSQLRLRLRETHHVPLSDRLDELVAFQAFMDSVHGIGAPPPIIRAQVIIQNYVCFVYLGESCFRELRKVLPSSSAAFKCCVFLTSNPVRAFRNALAHGNWRYVPDFSGIEFWARKGATLDEPLARWEVPQEDLTFWQAVARCTAYAAFLSL
jgi:hypothetical protein